jgi:hypothetical protein
MASEKNPAAHNIVECYDRILESGAVAFGIAWPRRPEGPILTIREIAAQHGETCIGKSLCQGNQEKSLTIRSRTVSQNKSVAVGSGGPMQESAHEWVYGNVSENLRAGF